MKKILATSASCGPCHMLKAKIEKMGLTVDIKSYNDPENISWFREHGIRSVPCLVIEKDDHPPEYVQGIDDIIKKIQEDDT